MKKLLFDNPLIEGLILRRKNRFIMDVLINGEVFICHCPCTGKINNILFENIPCLVSHNTSNLKRKTQYTVEAISLNNIEQRIKYWVGINQTKANKYIEYFLKTNQLKNILNHNKQTKILREQTIGNSKLDFFVDNCYIEVKTPLVKFQLKDYYFTNKNIVIKNNSEFTSTERLIKHVEELSSSLKTNHKAHLITLFMFNSNKFTPPISKNYKIVKEKILKARELGVKIWQVNTIFDKYGISLEDYYEMEL